MNAKSATIGIVLAIAAMSAFAQDSAPCQADVQKFCGQSDDDNQQFNCLLDHQQDVSDACYDSLKSRMQAEQGKQSAPPCDGCGKVVDVTVSEKPGQGGIIGLIGGGLGGAVLGHQIGGGRGKDLSTIAGALGGAYAGRKIEGNLSATKSWLVRVQLDDGAQRSFMFDHAPGFSAGDLVKVSGGSVIPQ